MSKKLTVFLSVVVMLLVASSAFAAVPIVKPNKVNGFFAGITAAYKHIEQNFETPTILQKKMGAPVKITSKPVQDPNAEPGTVLTADTYYYPGVKVLYEVIDKKNFCLYDVMVTKPNTSVSFNGIKIGSSLADIKAIMGPSKGCVEKSGNTYTYFYETTEFIFKLQDNKVVSMEYDSVE